MAKKFLTPIDMSRLELRNALAELIAGNPGSPTEGQFWYDTATKRLKFRSDVANVPVVTVGGDLGASSVLNTALATNPLARANHTGSQPASTVSDLATVVKAYRLDEFAAPNIAVPFNGQKITGLGTPTADTDAATKAYVDATAQGLDVKASVRAATTANIALSGAQTIDGVAVVATDRVLVKNQTAGAGNGIYVAAAGAWSRALDANSSAEVTAGMYAFVAEGTAAADSGWVLTTNDPITLDTTVLVFAQFTGAGTINAGAGLTKTGDVIDAIGTANRILVNANDIDISPNYVGQTSITTLGTIATGVWNGTDIAVADGGTGASTAAGAKTNLGFMSRFAVTFGDGAATSYTITHNLGTLDVIAQVVLVSTGAEEIVDILRATINTLTVTFAVAPATNTYRITVIG